jgi:hypothetical protein
MQTCRPGKVDRSKRMWPKGNQAESVGPRKEPMRIIFSDTIEELAKQELASARGVALWCSYETLNEAKRAALPTCPLEAGK